MNRLTAYEKDMINSLSDKLSSLLSEEFEIWIKVCDDPDRLAILLGLVTEEFGSQLADICAKGAFKDTRETLQRKVSEIRLANDA